MVKRFLLIFLFICLAGCVQNSKHTMIKEDLTVELKKFYIKNNVGFIELTAFNNSNKEINEFFVMMKFMDDKGNDVWTLGDCLNTGEDFNAPIKPKESITAKMQLPEEAKINKIKDFQILKLALECP